MNLEFIALVIRLVVLVGAVLFSFALLFFGFHIVLREYFSLNTWKKMKEFLDMTAQAGLQADVTKGTLSLNRATPGVLLIAIGSLILGFCTLQKFEYSSEQNTPKSVTSNEDIKEKNFQFEEQVSKALQLLEKRVEKLEDKNLSQDSSYKDSRKQISYLHFLSYNNNSNNVISQTENARNLYYTSNFFQQEQPKETLLDKWLKSTPDIKGKELTEQIKILLDRYGQVEIKFNRILVDKPKKVSQIALEEYGNARFEPLLLAFNPNLPKDASNVPIYTFIKVYYPASVDITSYRSQVSIKISGMSRAQVYDRILDIVNDIMMTEEYKKNPAKWWSTRFPQLGAVEFARSMDVETGRQWAVRQISAEDGDSPELMARIQYGNQRYVNILKFLNYQRPNLFHNTKAPLPNKTEIVALQLVEF